MIGRLETSAVEMSNAKIKGRRHSFSSIEDAAKVVGADAISSKQEPRIRLTVERKRKTPIDAAEVEEISSDVKRPAISLVDVVGNLQEVICKDHQQISEESLCCLPGGV